MSTVVTEAKNNTRFISWVVRCTIWLYTVFKTEWAQSVSSISNKKYTKGMIWFQTNIAWNNLNLMDDNNPGSHHCELILQKLCIWAWQITAMPSRTEHCNRFLWHSREIYAVNPCMLEHEGLVFNILRSFQQLPLQPLRKLLQQNSFLCIFWWSKAWFSWLRCFKLNFTKLQWQILQLHWIAHCFHLSGCQRHKAAFNNNTCTVINYSFLYSCL